MGLPMDEVDVEIAPGADLSADSSTWTWISLCEPEDGYPNGRVQRPLTITRGRTSEGGSAPPSTFTATVRNEDGALTPSNPMGPWYGSLGRGTPLRVTWGSSGRFFGFISELPTTWLGIVDNSRVEIRADGVMRRLEQGAKPLHSALYREIMALGSSLLAYWPCEEDSGAMQASSPLPRTLPIQPIGGEFGAGQDHPGGSAPAAVRIGEGAGGMLGSVRWHTTQTRYTAHQLVRIEALDAVERDLLNLYTTGTVGRWRLFVTSSNVVLQGIAADGTVLVDESTAISSAVAGQWLRVEVQIEQDGADVDWSYAIRTANLANTLLHLDLGTEASATLGRAARVGLGAGIAGAGAPDRFVSHIALLGSTGGAVFELAAIHGFTGETAGNRISRLCTEEGVTFTSVGDLDDTLPMGPQNPDTFLSLVRECADADLGLLHEPGDSPGLAYRTRASLYNQVATEVDFCDLNGAPQLLNDDNALRNDVTVSNSNGTFARLADQAHIDRHGRYDEQYQVNAATSGHLLHIAGWRLSMGTTDAPRWPLVAISINSETQHLLADWLALNIGDRLAIPHEVPQLPGVSVDLLVGGWVETIHSRRAEIMLNCVPASPWQVGEYESAEGGTYRYDTAGSSLAAQFVAGTGTSMSVAVDIKPLWTTDVDEFPFDIECGGVRLTVTAISGASSPQTFTINQTPVNGVAKTIPAGTSVSLWTKARYAL